ncbi:MAG: arsenate reductase (glutaredoxin) [Saprospirales bacterium]|nr:MAG: arsenate reductase (glutaredoxin) [Saprospirales bacterium]
MIIYHNPRCRKSRETLELLKENGVEPEVVKYLETPLDYEELKALVTRLNIGATELLRKGEKEYKENYKGKDLSEKEAIEAMVKFPKLMERPIVVKDNKAVIGRPPENVIQLIN